MARKKFIILLLLPLLLIIPLLRMEMDSTWHIGIFIATCIYVWVLQLLRLRYVGFTWKESIWVFVAGSLTKKWWRIWDKDPGRQREKNSSLPTI